MMVAIAPAMRWRKPVGASDAPGGTGAMGRGNSPEQIVGRRQLEGQPVMSHETIYRWIWSDKRGGGTLWKSLRGARKQRRKRYGQYDSRGRLAGKKAIEQRPDVVRDRGRIGDWEIDT